MFFLQKYLFLSQLPLLFQGWVSVPPPPHHEYPAFHTTPARCAASLWPPEGAYQPLQNIVLTAGDMLPLKINAKSVACFLTSMNTYLQIIWIKLWGFYSPSFCTWAIFS